MYAFDFHLGKKEKETKFGWKKNVYCLPFQIVRTLNIKY